MGQEDASDSSPSSAESSFRELDDVFLQTQTTIWLGEVLHTRLDEQLNISDLLADGELLFEVSKVIWKMLLTKCMELRHTKGYKYKPFASRKSSGRYLPYSNVDSFLKICKILGLTGIDLFSPSDVVEKRNTRKVCMCIRSLSKKARSKHLNVPDFDIVTYTVSMPTDMVGCIRRSLELSQCSFLSSANHSPHKDSKMKCRQKNSGTAGTRNYELYSEESDDTESIYMVVGSHSPSATYSYDTASLMNSDFEISPGVSSDVESYTLSPSVLQLDIRDHEKDECTPGECGSLCLTESVRTPCSGPMKDDNEPDSMSSSSCISSQIRLGGMVSCINNGVRHSHQNYAVDLIHSGHELGTGASIVGASVDGNSSLSSAVHHLAISDLIGHGADNSDSVLFDGEDSIYNVYMGTDSHGSNSTQKTFVNGFGRILSDDIEDAEVSSMASMNSVSGRVLNLDFDDQLGAEYDFKTVKVQFPELQIGKVDFFETNYMRVYESRDRVKDKTMVHTSKPDTEGPRFDMEVEGIGFSTKLFQPSPNWQSYATGCPDHVSSHNGICISQISSNVANDEDKLSSNLSSPLNNKGAFKNVDWDEFQGLLSGQSHSTCDSHKWNEKHNYAMALLSNGNDGHRASPKFVSSEGIRKEFLHRSPTKASGDALWIKDMKSIVADDDKEIFSANLVNSGPDNEELPDSFFQADCFTDIIETAYEDSNASSYTVAVEECGKCCKLSRTDDGRGFQHHNIMIQHINDQGRHIPEAVAACNPSVHCNFVIPSNTCEPTPEKHNHLTIECSEDVGKKDDQACTDHSNLYCVDNVDKSNCQDESKHETVNMLEGEILDGRENASVGIPPRKAHKRPLLKSVIKGTALVGVLFALLHLRRRSVGEKTGESSIQSSQIHKAKGVEFSSRKGIKGGSINGFYPAENLKFGS